MLLANPQPSYCSNSNLQAVLQALPALFRFQLHLILLVWLYLIAPAGSPSLNYVPLVPHLANPACVPCLLPLLAATDQAPSGKSSLKMYVLVPCPGLKVTNYPSQEPLTSPL